MQSGFPKAKESLLHQVVVNGHCRISLDGMRDKAAILKEQSLCGLTVVQALAASAAMAFAVIALYRAFSCAEIFSRFFAL